MTFASSKMSLYTCVEVFLFKYLSDINVLKDKNSFSYIYSLYSVDESTRLTNADILGAYLEGPRAQMKMLFPDGEDGTTIVNGQKDTAQQISLHKVSLEKFTGQKLIKYILLALRLQMLIFHISKKYVV